MKNKNNGETYYTLSGVPSKDTLSIREQKELDEKRKNNTLTNKDREKLWNDDSIGSRRSRSGWLYKDRVKYNPNVEYFMVDYMDRTDMSHIRLPYMTQLELVGFLRHFVEDSGFLTISNLNITSENRLDRKLDVKCQDDKIRQFSLRELIFDERYERISNRVKDEKSNFLKEIYERRNPPEVEMDDEEDNEDTSNYTQHQLYEMEHQVHNDQIRLS